MQYFQYMAWQLFHLDYFSAWLDDQDEDLQDETLAHLGMLKELGPLLKRPYADTLHGSNISNLKELRFSYKGAPIRILFAFDPRNKELSFLEAIRLAINDGMTKIFLLQKNYIKSILKHFQMKRIKRERRKNDEQKSQ